MASLKSSCHALYVKLSKVSCGMYLPYADSARLVVGTWWLVVLVVATTYCGNLVAFLTFPKIDIPITTVDELLAHRDTVTWSVSKGSYFEHEIKASKDGKFHALYEGMIKRNIPHEKMIRGVENGKHIYFDWKTKLQFYMKKQFLETERCNLALAREEFFDERIGIIIAPDTPYLVRINAEIKKLHQVGLIEKWFKKYLPKKDRCFKVGHVTEVNNHTVNMDDMQGSFFVLFLGFLIGASWLIVEKLWYRYRLKRTQKVQPYVT